MIKLFVQLIVLFFSANCFAAAGDIIYQNCTAASSCTGAGSNVGWVRTVVSSGCYSGSCLKLVGVFNTNPNRTDDNDYGAGSTSLPTSSSVNGETELTIYVKLKYSNPIGDISHGNMKVDRAYTGGGMFYGTSIIPHPNADFYMGAMTGTMTNKASWFDMTEYTDNRAFPINNGNGTWTVDGFIQGNFTYGAPVDFGTSWQQYTKYLKTPSTSSSNDGHIKVWLNGELLYEIINAGYEDRYTGGPSFTGLNFYPSSEAGEPFEHWKDDMIIYEGYVPPDGSAQDPGSEIIDYDFNNQSFGDLTAGSYWTMQSSGGVDNSAAARLEYSTAGNPEKALKLDLSSFDSQEYWIEFDTKMQGTCSGGSKFVKFFGHPSTDSQNNMTFMLDYGNCKQADIDYYYDNSCRAGWNGSATCNPGSPAQYDYSSNEIDISGGSWGTYKLHVKRADPGQSNGTVEVWWNDSLVADVYNIQSNPSGASTDEIAYVEFGGYNDADDFTGSTWYLWIDNLYVGTEEKTGGSPDTTPPTVTSVTVSGTTLTVYFSESVSTSDYESGDLKLDCDNTGQNLSATSPVGTGTSRTFSVTSIANGDTCTLDGSALTTGDIVDTATSPNSMVAFSGTSVTVPSVTYTLSTTKSGTGDGSYVLVPAGGTYAAGTEVVVTAVADGSSEVDSWDTCSGTVSGDTCTVTMNSDLGVEAVFNTATVDCAAGANWWLCNQTDCGTYDLEWYEDSCHTIPKDSRAGALVNKYSFSSWSGGLPIGFDSYDSTEVSEVSGKVLLTATANDTAEIHIVLPAVGEYIACLDLINISNEHENWTSDQADSPIIYSAADGISRTVCQYVSRTTGATEYRIFLQALGGTSLIDNYMLFEYDESTEPEPAPIGRFFPIRSQSGQIYAPRLCEALTGSIATEDFSGSGLANTIFESDDDNVSDPTAYDNTAVTASCFSGESFQVDGADYWTRINSYTEPVQCHEFDFYLTSESLSDGDASYVTSITNSANYSLINFRMVQAAGSLKLRGWFTEQKGEEVPIETGKTYRLGMCHDSTANTGSWVVYDYDSMANLGSWSGAVSDTLATNNGIYLGPIANTSGYVANFDNVSIDTDWMQLAPAEVEASTVVPLLLVHGWFGSSASAWPDMIDNLEAAGFPSNMIYTIDIQENNLVLCNTSHMAEVAARVEEIVAATGYEKIDIMGHSRGGLNSYQYMLWGNGVNRIRNLITIAGANQSCPDDYGSQPADKTPGVTAYTAIWSPDDGNAAVAPMAEIVGGRNIELDLDPAITHETIKSDTRVTPYIMDALSGAGYNDGVPVN